MWAALVVPVVLAIWLTAPAWGGRPVGGDDVMGHLVRADFGLHHLILNLRLDGWFPRFMVGSQEFLLYGPAFGWLIAAIRLVTLGQLSDVGAMKVVSIGSTIAIGPAVAYLARSFGLERRAAILAAILAYAVDSPFGVGVTATFQIGLVPEQASAPLFCLAVGGCWRVLDGRTDGRRVAVAAMVALVLMHPITVMETVVLLGIPIVWKLVSLTARPSAIIRLIGALGATAGLCAYWLLPYVAHWNLRGPVATWTTPSLHQRVHDILAGHILFAHGVGIMIIAAGIAVVILAIARRPAPVMLVVVPVLWLLIGDYSHRHNFPNADVGLLLENRGLGLAGLMTVLILAFSLDAMTGPLWDAIGAWSPGRQWLWAGLGDAAALVAALGIVLVPVHFHRIAREQPPAKPALRQAAGMLRSMVPPAGRWAIERDPSIEVPETGVSQPDLWLAYESGRNDLDVFNGESSSSAGAGYATGDITTVDPATFADRMLGLGVGHVVTENASTEARLVDSGRFTEQWTSGGLAILSVLPTAAVPDPDTLLSASTSAGLSSAISASDPGRPRWDVVVAEASPVTVAIAWSPKWHATLDGHAVPIERVGEYHLMAVDVPAGQHHLALDYRSDIWDHLGMLISLLTIAGLIGRWWLLRRQGRSGPPAEDERRAPAEDEQRAPAEDERRAPPAEHEPLG